MLSKRFKYPFSPFTRHCRALKSTVCRSGLVLLGLLLVSTQLSAVTSQVYADQTETGVDVGESLGTNPKSRQPVITATVPDLQTPSVPILISPSNEALLTTSKPVFVWKPSTDNVGVTGYQFWLNGLLKFDQLPTASSDNPEYTLTFNTLSNQFELALKSNLVDANYSWKVTAFDAAGNTISSATWSFLIDTQAPIFILNQVDQLSTAISAQDLATIPTTALELTNNQPLLAGVGESNSMVKLVVLKGSTILTNLNFTILGNGSWQIKLPTLPRDTLIWLNFEITDQAGNLTVLNQVPIILKTPYVAVPIIPIIPGVIEQPIVISLPTAVPTQQLLPIINRLTSNLPDPLAKVVAAGLYQLATFQRPGPWVNYFALLWLIWPLLLSFIWMSWPLGRRFSIQSVAEVLRALDLLPLSQPRGWVFNSQSKKGVAYVQVIATGLLYNGLSQSVTKITNRDGFFSRHGLSAGKFRYSVVARGYHFPSANKRAANLRQDQFYLGHELIIDQDHPEPALQIPLDRNSLAPRTDHFWFRLTQLAKLGGRWRYPHLAVAVLWLILSPTSQTLLPLLVYIAVLSKELAQNLTNQAQ